MMQKQQKTGMLEQAALRLNLPGEVLAGVPKIEITGRSRVKIENHKGLIEYTPEYIEINAGRVMIRVRGELMNIKSMSADSLLIEGTVISVELD